ncbi:MAG: transposase [Saprospiraceae bacterium]|nr:transposase [Saprospiraceae bacterium]
MKKRKFTAKFKTKVVLEALKEVTSLSDLAKKYNLAPTQISNWKRQFLEGAEEVFSSTKGGKTEEEREKDKLLRTIGELKVENDFLKKVLK